MSAIGLGESGAVTRGSRPDGVRAAFEAELSKLLAQMPTRLLALVCALGPLAFAAMLRAQSGTPSDAIFGVWVHSSGFAVSLVLLGFAGSWGLPIVAGLIAGDLFSAEERLGTWKTILTRSCTREDLFTGKLLAAGLVSIGLTILLAAASLIAGVILIGAHPLVNLSGVVIGPGRLLVLTLVSWLTCVLPVLAYLSLAVLVSVATRNGILGVVAPLLAALAYQLLDLIGRGVLMHLVLIGSAFDGWHGLFVSRPYLGPLLVSSAVCLAWIVVCLSLSWRILRRRDFVGDGAGSGSRWASPIRTVAIATAVIAALAVAGNLGPTGVTAYRVALTVGHEFNHVTLLQQRLIGRDSPPGARLNVQPQCNRRGARPVGPGDWNCNLFVYLPQLKSVPYQLTSVEYDVSVEPNGCFKAQSPPAFIGGPTMVGQSGRRVTNPLYVVYGCFNIL